MSPSDVVGAAWRAEEAVAADLRDTQRLRDLSARLMAEGDLQVLHDEIMATAIALTRADAGTMQVLDDDTNELVLLAAHGFDPNMIEHFHRVNASSGSPCGVALATRERCFIDFDVPASADPDGALRMHVEAGYLSGQSTPLIARSGRVIGMFSTHWRERRRPAERELRFLDLLARQAADLIERHQAEAALRENEARFRTLVEPWAQAVWETNAAGMVVADSPSWRAYTGQTLEQYLGEGWLQAVHPDDQERALRTWRESVCNATAVVAEYRLRTRDGAWRWTSMRSAPLCNPDGSVRKWSGMNVDITDRKRAEEALRASEQRLAAEVEALADLHALTDRLLACPDVQSALEATLDATLAMHGTDMGTIQVLDLAAGGLRFAAHRGFDPALIAELPVIDKDFHSPCAAALRVGRRVIVDDLDTEPAFQPHSLTAAQLGYRAAQSTPLMTLRGELQGILTTHFREPRSLDEQQLRLTDLYARQAAHLIERMRGEAALRRARDELEARVAERTAELARANEQLRAEVRQRQRAEDVRTDLLRKIARAQEDERRRVARDLHDSVGQLLAGLSLAVKAVSGRDLLPPPATARLAEVQRLADELGRQVHALAVQLRPTALDDLGLTAALGHLVGEWSAQTKVPVDFQTVGLDGERLPAEAETALYRVVQEALTNVAKHARARQVSVVVGRHDGHATAVVEDDGLGFDPEAPGSGRLGLVGMRERVALAGGELDVESSPGAGTTVIARVPTGDGERRDSDE
ncbi:GAF domain-containing protein [Sorangium sp. So ce1078]|uniref:GAF domain-containing protein n=1 Tax=Sorangium sp. So ce1078 TaxID=3133329 RepID=UPI003F5E4A22